MKKLSLNNNLISKIKGIFFPFYRSKEVSKIFDILEKDQPKNKKAAMFVGGCVRKYILGEKIDVVDWNEDPKILITNSLSPASVSNVSINPDDSSAIVTVPKKQLSLAIGKEGQNARLAAKLTLWKIDVQAEEEIAIPKEKKVEPPVTTVSNDTTENEPKITGDEKPEISKEEIFSDNVLSDIDQAEVVVKENSVDEKAELMALEKEIQELEQKEEKEAKKKKQKEDILDFSSEDIWNLGGKSSKETSDDTIRFAEDIESLNTFNNDGKNSKKSDRRKKNKR